MGGVRWEGERGEVRWEGERGFGYLVWMGRRGGEEGGCGD